ncbi:hypothetical protein CHS0354_029800 [Potamilus streckersoni]|uniref:Carboxylic ester hydrolase n=1 Tax=Potamilus streckersoni TaxID=2493646 RepID=A0AAE0TI24_9BIVA|nr:hypothetical protein CHS0354_029800 [Potamilus streckersoni]
MDQRQALIWVNQNIRSFGGDPSNVTLFGQSAGAQSTLIHVMSSKSAPYFQKAIIESAPISIPYKKTVDALVLADTIADLLNCQLRDAKCLRSKTAEEIVIAQTLARSKFTSLKLLELFEPLGPRVDGDEVHMEPIDALHEGKFRDIPIMLGTVTEEARIYVFEAWTKSVKSSTAAAILLATYPAHYLQIIDKYPMVNKTDARDDLVQIGTDFIFTCSARYAMDNFAKFNKNPTFRYEFDHAFSFNGGWENFTACDHHVCHGSELIYVFHTARQGGYILTSDEEALSKSMIIYWSNFAATSDPNKGLHTGEKIWPRYYSGQPQKVMYFMTPENKIVENFRKTYCDFWDRIGYSA